MAKTKKQAEKEARNIVDGWAATSALTGWIPFSALFLTGADLIMARQVADAFGIGVFDEDAVNSAIATAISSGAMNALIAEVVGWIPVFGWAAKSAAMTAKAKAIGEFVIEYFRDISPLTN